MAGHSAQGVVRVGRKPKTASETEIVRLITATNESTPIGNFTQLVKDMTAAGIVIGKDYVAIKAKQTSVIDENNNTIAMFSNGKLNANLIDADKIEVKHLWAKSEDGTTKVGYFGNTENVDACKVNDNTYAPLFIGKGTAKESPYYVTSDGHMVSKSATLGCFTLDTTSLRYDSGYNGQEPGMVLTNNYMIFRGYSRNYNANTGLLESKRNRMVWLGENNFPLLIYDKKSNIYIEDSEKKKEISSVGLYVSVDGSNNDTQYSGMEFLAKPFGNFAIYAEKGMYAGFRPMTRTISNSQTLSELDCYIEVTAEVTLTLPANPQRGQTYWIMRSVYKGVKTIVKGNGKQVYTPAGNGETVEFTSANEIIWLTYIKDNWKALWLTP